MRTFYRLQICFEPSIETYNSLTEIFGIQPSEKKTIKFPDSIPSVWDYEVVKEKKDLYFDFINIFSDIIEPKISEIEKLNINRTDISYWFLYEYNQQCNMEFDPIRLKRMSDIGATLCISCWQS